jgi:5-oxoprolinase (ATP-hydrolysing)
MLDAVRLVLPTGIVAPEFGPDDTHSPAVSAGNTELSERLADTLLKAFGIVAASQGTMNNLLFGNSDFGYYETIGGGAGAGATFAGASAVHCHMTNTRITDVEIMEYRYPVRVHRFGIRRGSGGDGIYRGGDGILREIEALVPLTLSFVSERRASGPYGLAGGSPGQAGAQWLIRKSGTKETIDGRATRMLDAGDRVVIETPGGGGFGKR